MRLILVTALHGLCEDRRDRSPCRKWDSVWYCPVNSGAFLRAVLRGIAWAANRDIQSF